MLPVVTHHVASAVAIIASSMPSPLPRPSLLASLLVAGGVLAALTAVVDVRDVPSLQVQQAPPLLQYAAAAAADAADTAAVGNPCGAITVTGRTWPVTYMGEPRANPDGTYYPLDAMYYMFEWQDRSDPGQCAIASPKITSSNLVMNHTGVALGEMPPEGRPVPVPAFRSHQSLDPVVELVETSNFHYAVRGDKSCFLETRASPSDMPRFFTHYTIYDEPFLSKKNDRTLEQYERLSARPAGEKSWEWFVGTPLTKKGDADGWARCETGGGGGTASGGGGGDEEEDLSPVPHPVEMAGTAGGGNVYIFRIPSHAWEITYNGTRHAHDPAWNTPADGAAYVEYQERIEACKSRVTADSGCIWGTAEVMPYPGMCLFADVAPKEELAEAPPGIDNRTYVAPLEDICTGGWRAGSSTTNTNTNTAAPGRAEIEDGLSAVLKLEITGSYKVARNGMEITYRTTETEDLSPPLLAPVLNITLTKPPAHHMEHYEAKNLDGTYYLRDPIQIHHSPDWKWKEHRHKHINFTVSPLHDRIPTEKHFHCGTMRADGNRTDQPCLDPINVEGWRNDTIAYGNGDGHTIHVAPPHTGLGPHRFAYEMSAWNLGRWAANGTNHTTAVLAPYDPSYSYSYPYQVLRDAQEYGFDDRRGVVVTYDGGTALNGTLVHDRRSLINWWTALGTMHNITSHEYIPQPHILSTARNVFPPDRASLEHTAGTQTAMFVRSGYGALLFEWPVSRHVLDPATGAARYENVSSYMELRSRDFAGAHDTRLLDTYLRYTEMPFSKQLVVKSVNQSGHVQAGDTIRLRVEPDTGMGAEYIADYIRDKVGRDTGGDRIIAQAVLDDTHSMVQEWSTDTGVLNVTVLRTSAYFSDMSPQNDTWTAAWEDDQQPEHVLPVLADSPEHLRLAAPLDMGLAVPPPVTLNITLNNQTARLFDHKYYSFGGREEIIINARRDNIANVERVPGSIIISEPENFGIIKRVVIDGGELGQPCHRGCFVMFMPTDRHLQVTLYNAWGGAAHGVVGEHRQAASPVQEWPRW